MGRGAILISPNEAARAIDPETRRAVSLFLATVRSYYPVREALLFGSRRRGTHSAESDADVAVVLEGPRGDRLAIASEMARLAFHVMMETGVMVEALPLWSVDLERPDAFPNSSLIENIRREGLRL